MESSEQHQTQSPLTNAFCTECAGLPEHGWVRPVLLPLASSSLAMGSQLLQVGEESLHRTQIQTVCTAQPILVTNTCSRILTGP